MSSLKFFEHCIKAKNHKSKMLRFINKTVTYKIKKVIIKLYTQMWGYIYLYEKYNSLWGSAKMSNQVILCLLCINL